MAKTALTAHQLGRLLLEGPDLPVIGSQRGDDLGDYYAATDIEDHDDETWEEDGKRLRGSAITLVYW